MLFTAKTKEKKESPSEIFQIDLAFIMPPSHLTTLFFRSGIASKISIFYGLIDPQ